MSADSYSWLSTCTRVRFEELDVEPVSPSVVNGLVSRTVGFQCEL